jgi:hypothetical protein
MTNNRHNKYNYLKIAEIVKFKYLRIFIIVFVSTFIFKVPKGNKLTHELFEYGNIIP